VLCRRFLRADDLLGGMGSGRLSIPPPATERSQIQEAVRGVFWEGPGMGPVEDEGFQRAPRGPSRQESRVHEPGSQRSRRVRLHAAPASRTTADILTNHLAYGGSPVLRHHRRIRRRRLQPRDPSINRKQDVGVPVLSRNSISSDVLQGPRHSAGAVAVPPPARPAADASDLSPVAEECARVLPRG
jgi:hypothetical protein